MTVLLVTKLDTSPPSLCTSFTSLDEMKDFDKEGIVPNLGALQVTGIDVNWLKQNPSPYQSNEILEKEMRILESWTSKVLEL